MNTTALDNAFIKSGINELETYLLAAELYWPLTSTSGYNLPRLTIGGLLLSLKRWKARVYDPSDRMDLERAQNKLELIRQKWRVHWEKKAEQEFSARLALWNNFLADYKSSPDMQADLYRHEVRWRVLLDLLEPELPHTKHHNINMLLQLDRTLKLYWLPGEFIWEPELSTSFPRADYWYLYGHLKG